MFKQQYESTAVQKAPFVIKITTMEIIDKFYGLFQYFFDLLSVPEIF